MIRLSLAVGALALSAAAVAQVPPNIAEANRTNGQTMNNNGAALYGPLFPAEAWRGVTITRDIAYGTDAKQTLDVYAPEAGGRGLPVLLFVHGGGFTGGDKHGAFYPDNVTLWAVREGMVGVNVNYRLAPGAAFPEASRDLAATIAWTRANIARYGGDPNRIVLFGHSAGGNHVADYVAHRDLHGAEFASIKGAVLLSPFYAPAPTGTPPHNYYGSVVDRQAAPAQIARLGQAGVPLFVGYAQYDPEMMRVFSRSLIDTLCKEPARCPAHVDLKDHNHFTEGMALGTADRSLADPLARWIKALP